MLRRRFVERIGSRPRFQTSERGFGLIEIMVAITLATIGLLSIAGLQVAVASQGRMAAWRTGQALAAQEVFERVVEEGYAAAVTRPDSATVAGNTYRVNMVVNTIAPRVKRVRLTVQALGTVGAQTFTSQLHEPRPVPPRP